VVYFSDCQAGAAAGCVPGNNANAGTSPAAPKQNLAGYNFNAAPAGTRLLFARGGAWANVAITIGNPNARATNPMVFDAYTPASGATAAPLMRVPSGARGFNFEARGHDEGYVMRNLKIDGGASGLWAVYAADDVSNITIDNVEMTNFDIAVHVQANSTAPVRFLTVRNSQIHRNRTIGMLGHSDDMTIEGTTFEANGSGSEYNHALYLSGREVHSRAVIRNNRFINNSTGSGTTCTGGNITVHGVWDDVLIEGNTVTQQASSPSCYGISMNPGYAEGESMTRFVVRGNLLANLGCGICASSVPGVVVENNTVVNTLSGWRAGINIGNASPAAGDAADTGATVRNNTVYFAQAGSSVAIRADVGSNLRVASNLVYLGAGSAGSRCFRHAALSSYAAFNNNLCHDAAGNAGYSTTYATLTAARGAGFDTAGQLADPLFQAVPAAANGWNDALRAGSPAVNGGHATLSTTIDRVRATRVTPDIGAREL
jgi:hypothetical protein